MVCEEQRQGAKYKCDCFVMRSVERRGGGAEKQHGCQVKRTFSWELYDSTRLTSAQSGLVSPVGAILCVRRHGPKRYQHGDWFRNQGDGGNKLGSEVHPAVDASVRACEV